MFAVGLTPPVPPFSTRAATPHGRRPCGERRRCRCRARRRPAAAAAAAAAAGALRGSSACTCRVASTHMCETQHIYVRVPRSKGRGAATNDFAYPHGDGGRAGAGGGVRRDQANGSRRMGVSCAPSPRRVGGAWAARGRRVGGACRPRVAVRAEHERRGDGEGRDERRGHAKEGGLG